MTRSALVLTLLLMLIVLVAARPLVTLFLGANTDARELAITGVRLFALTLPPSALNTSFKNYYLGVTRVQLSELISAMQNFVLPALCALLLTRFIGTNGAWLCFVCGETLALLMISLIVWYRNKHCVVTADAYSLLEPSFGTSPEHCFERSLDSEEDAVTISRQIHSFCRARGLDERTSTLISLCVEEMTINIITHGFTKDSRSHNVDVRLVLNDDGGVIRIRDNCIHFDPTQYMELHQSNDPVAHIGIRMVMAMVKEANYVNPLGLNNLTLTL